MTRLFGTDGIRGVANEEPLTPELAFRVGRQLVATLQVDHGVSHARIVIGRDTRRSGPLLEAALISGCLSSGADCFSVGVLPTPAIAMLTRRLEAHGGIVLSASHNPFEDNGIKLFSSEGTKFPDAWEAEIERRLGEEDTAPRSASRRACSGGWERGWLRWARGRTAPTSTPPPAPSIRRSSRRRFAPAARRSASPSMATAIGSSPSITPARSATATTPWRSPAVTWRRASGSSRIS